MEYQVKVRLNSALREDTVEKATLESDQKTDQKTEKWPENDQKTGGKSMEKSREKIMLMMKEHSGITQSELAESLKISVKAVEKHIKNLREHGINRRVGGYVYILPNPIEFDAFRNQTGL